MTETTNWTLKSFDTEVVKDQLVITATLVHQGREEGLMRFLPANASPQQTANALQSMAFELRRYI